jgi:hypothetical protein
MVTLPVYLVGQGNENAVEFSITFPTSVLAYASIQLGSGAADAVFNANQDQTTSGRLGVSLALTAGSSFAADTQELVVVTFAVADNIGTTTANISFGDQPLGREISDPLANSLRASYLGGTVVIVGAEFEGDVTPVPDGNGNDTVTDWIKIGRYAAKLDTVPSPSQFQRADCAPRSSLGNGTITLTDWVQAGRYAAGLDPLTPAGGPTAPTEALAAKSMSALSPLASAAAREVRIPGVGLRAGQTNRIPVLLVAQGNESGIGFSVNFDATMLSFVSAAAGSNATGAVLNVNTSQAATGQIGLVLSLPIGTNTFAMGTQEVAALRFFVSSNAMGAASAVFGDQPVIREVSDPFANTLAAVYVNGVLPVTPSLKISRGGMANVLAWPTWGSNLVLEATDNLRPMSLWNSPLATATNIAGGEIRLTIPDTLSQRFFRLRSP